MKLIQIPATETTPRSIDIIDNKGNKFAEIDCYGNLKVIGEDMSIDYEELKSVMAIAENFNLFYNNI